MTRGVVPASFSPCKSAVHQCESVIKQFFRDAGTKANEFSVIVG